jgi:hypothetical protein
VAVASGFIAGDPIVDRFIGLNGAGDPVAGETFTVVSALKPNDTSFVPTVTDQLNGIYKVQVATATTEAGTWSLLLRGVTYPDQIYPFAWRVDAPTITDALARIGSAPVAISSPILRDGTLLRLVQGDDYSLTDIRALEWSTTESATIALHITTAATSFAGSVVTPTGATKRVRVQPTSAFTGGLRSGGAGFQVVATLASGRVVTLATGQVEVVARVIP